MSNTSRSPRLRTRRPNVIAAVTACAALGVAACGSSTPTTSATTGSASSTSAASSSATTAQASAAPVTISFGDLAPNSALTPFYAAVDQGFFKQNGLNVVVTKFSGGGAPSVAALATGSVQVASGGPTNFISDIARNVVKGQLIGESQDANYDVVTSKSITSISQLKGKIIGVSGANSADEIFLEATLAHYGISPNQVTFLTSGTLAERLTALSTGKIQATADSASFRAAELAVGNVVLKAENNPVTVPTVTFWAEQSYINSNAATLTKFIHAVAQAGQWVKTPANLAQAIKDCEQGSGSTASECQQQITYAETPAIAGPWTWSSTFAVNTAGIAQAIKAVALVLPSASSLTVSQVVDSAIAGTQP